MLLELDLIDKEIKALESKMINNPADEFVKNEILTPRTAVHALETENLLLVAEMMADAALLRQESRGSHFREDHPERDDRRWLVNILWTLAEGELVPSFGRYRQDPASSVQLEQRPGPAAARARDHRHMRT